MVRRCRLFSIVGQIMKSFLIIALLSANQALCTQMWPSQDDCTKAEENVFTRTIEISAGDFQSIAFEITTKGNGFISLPGLNIRIYDSHDDGLVFENNLLKCEWKDADDDGFLDLVVSGSSIRTGDDDGGKPTKVMIGGVFRWNPKNRRFEVNRCSPEIYTWDGSQSK